VTPLKSNCKFLNAVGGDGAVLTSQRLPIGLTKLA
jgi:hypothetical protein